jgi:hypothetical protein
MEIDKEAADGEEKEDVQMEEKEDEEFVAERKQVDAVRSLFTGLKFFLSREVRLCFFFFNYFLFPLLYLFSSSPLLLLTTC